MIRDKLYYNYYTMTAVSCVGNYNRTQSVTYRSVDVDTHFMI